MSAERSDYSCGEDQTPTGRTRNNVALMAETLRNGAGRDVAAPPAKGEEKISVFWRVFGGTILSIVALVVITVYQQFSSSLAELRNDMIRSNEARAELLKKDEFNSRMVLGRPTIEPRVVPAPVRMPLPPAPFQGSIY